jgi:hypothetical protein
MLTLHVSADQSPSRSPHIMDVKEVQGLLAIMAVGNVVELSSALNHRIYENQNVNELEMQEQEAATTRYRLFIRWFSDNFSVTIGEEWINPTYLFLKRLVDFSATIYSYELAEHAKIHRANRIRDLNPNTLRKMLRFHFLRNWPQLTGYFDQAVLSPSPQLYYTGPQFEIARREDAERAFLEASKVESLQWKQVPIYFDVSGPVVGSDTRKRSHAQVPSSPLMSPSVSHHMKRSRVRQDVEESEEEEDMVD